MLMSLFLCIGVLSTAYAQNEKVNIVGFIKAVETDDVDNIIQVAVAVPDTITDEVDEEDDENTFYTYYNVTNDKKGKELLRLIDQKVEVPAIVISENEDSYNIRVLDFTVILDETDESDHDPEEPDRDGEDDE